MEVTKVNYFIQERRSWAYPLAKCSVVLDNQLRLNGICLYEGSNGKFITFPGRKRFSEDCEENAEKATKNRNEIFHPIEREFADYLKNVIIEGYQKVVEKKSFSYSPEDGKIEKDAPIVESEGSKDDVKEEGTEVS